ncbi:cytochrome P450 4C1-like [Thrips palmi]|uniref:Cytochrome P450 4C1-like n=1 Tax=Thrips palmi TaxID=161013 RepID=A0A6P9AL23_THRPL|nr:cytochrome P450 4C1-like [Thrips palmi]
MTVVTEVMVLAALAGVAVLLVRFLSSYQHFRKLELAIPGRPTLPLLGNALDFATATPDTVLQTVLWAVDGRRQLTRASIFNNLLVAIQDPVEIEEVVRRKEFNDKSYFIYNHIRSIIGERGLIQLGGPEWKAHRRWLQPGFNQNVLDRFVSVFSEEARGFVDRVEDTEKAVCVQENLRRTVMRDFIRTSMTAEGSQFDDELMDVVEFVEAAVRTINSRSFNPILWSDRVFALTPLGRKLASLKGSLDSLSKRMITAKREQLADNKEFEYERARKTLMDIMLGTEDGDKRHHVEEAAVIEEFKTFLGANVETTVSGLSWMLKVLSMQPEVQDRLHAELVSVFGDSDRDVTPEDLLELKYLDRVIKEVMRMFPPIPITARQCYEETKLCGHTIPAGTTIALNIFSAHRDPMHWDKPEVFDPDRFLPERSKGRHPCAYIPFSTGARNCIGGKYALMNMASFLATTLRAFRLLPVDDHKDLESLAKNMTFDLSSHLVGGTRVRFQRRGALGA